jgi:hypothetical protein
MKISQKFHKVELSSSSKKKEKKETRSLSFSGFQISGTQKPKSHISLRHLTSLVHTSRKFPRKTFHLVDQLFVRHENVETVHALKRKLTWKTLPARTPKISPILLYVSFTRSCRLWN